MYVHDGQRRHKWHVQDKGQTLCGAVVPVAQRKRKTPPYGVCATCKSVARRVEVAAR